MTSGISSDQAGARRAAVTLRDVAREAGVGLGTASRALAPGSQYVADDVRSRVLAVAERLSYRPNASARATTTGSTPTIAVLVSDIRDPYYAQLVHGAIGKARGDGQMVTITGTDHAVDDEVRVIRMLRSQRPRALVLTGPRTGSPASLLRELERYERDGGRVVVAGDDDLPFDTAVVPRQEGARLLVTTLRELGYRSIALIRPAADTADVRAWEAGIVQGARAAGVRVDVVRTPGVERSRDGGRAATAELLDDGRPDVDAVVAATDTMALGALSAVRDAGLEPGRDLGVAGFDDVVDADDVVPGLTSVDLSLEAIGGAAVDLALLAPAAERRRIEFDARVAVRGSTPPRG
ncbi:LacI family DNA-binding transcriptional regulator [Myceligenerans indicum]|uniref:LacI family transcriptional regulator n=1 Tax=Myceligenerans indicum TaxID=2593663 RepID=A0ABS1LJE5_9MICO|nr:LacI family DNA-binding transcriptional regulator [Myceligenerans indicum]MBL0885948.1 LacI family transcriptional regulator [Myceligenerans indicum]